MDNTHQLVAQMGFFVLIPALFFVVGMATACNILWGLLTGGPRALQAPGAPYLYDRVYYLIFLVVLVGWSGALLAFVAEAGTPTDGAGFTLGWGILAIGMGTLFLTKADMMLKGAQYRAKNGFWLWRFHYALQARQWERQSPIVRKLLGGVFVVAGIGATLYSLPHLPLALSEMAMGATRLISIAGNLLTPAPK